MRCSTPRPSPTTPRLTLMQTKQTTRRLYCSRSRSSPRGRRPQHGRQTRPTRAARASGQDLAHGHSSAGLTASAWSTLTRMARDECAVVGRAAIRGEGSHFDRSSIASIGPARGEWQTVHVQMNHLQGCLSAPSPRLQPRRASCSLRRSHHHRGMRRHGRNLARSTRSGQDRRGSYTLAKPHRSRAGPTPPPRLLRRLGRLRPLQDPPVPPSS